MKRLRHGYGTAAAQLRNTVKAFESAWRMNERAALERPHAPHAMQVPPRPHRVSAAPLSPPPPRPPPLALDVAASVAASVVVRVSASVAASVAIRAAIRAASMSPVCLLERIARARHAHLHTLTPTGTISTRLARVSHASRARRPARRPTRPTARPRVLARLPRLDRHATHARISRPEPSSRSRLSATPATDWRAPRHALDRAPGGGGGGGGASARNTCARVAPPATPNGRDTLTSSPPPRDPTGRVGRRRESPEHAKPPACRDVPNIRRPCFHNPNTRTPHPPLALTRMRRDRPTLQTCPTAPRSIPIPRAAQSRPPPRHRAVRMSRESRASPHTPTHTHTHTFTSSTRR